MKPKFSRWNCPVCKSPMFPHENNRFRFTDENNDEIVVDVSCSVCHNCNETSFEMAETKKILKALESGKSKNVSIVPDLKEIQELTEKTKNSIGYKKIQKLKESFATVIREAALNGEWEAKVFFDNHIPLDLLKKVLDEYKESGFGLVKVEKNHNLSAIIFHWEK